MLIRKIQRRMVLLGPRLTNQAGVRIIRACVSRCMYSYDNTRSTKSVTEGCLPRHSPVYITRQAVNLGAKYF